MDLSVVTVSHGHVNEVKTLYKSIIEKEWKVNYELILIDNLPPHKTAKMAKRHFKDVKIIRNDRPHGFAHNVNSGIRRSKGRYVFLINPDVIVLEGLFDKMVEFMDLHPRVGIAAPVLLNPDGSRQPSARRFPNFMVMLLRGLGIDRFLGKIQLNQRYISIDIPKSTSFIHVDWVAGAAMIIRKSAYNEVGPFDEKRFFLYFEDVDYCYRFWKSGWEVAYVTDTRAIHEWKRHSRNPFSVYKFYHIISGLRFFKKYGLRLKNPREGSR